MKSLLKKSLALICIGMFMSSVFAVDNMQGNSEEMKPATEHHHKHKHGHKKVKKNCCGCKKAKHKHHHKKTMDKMHTEEHQEKMTGQ